MTPTAALRCFIGPTEANLVTYQTNRAKQNIAIKRLTTLLKADDEGVIFIMARIRKAAHSGEDFVKFNRGGEPDSLFQLLSNCGYTVDYEPATITVSWRNV